MWNSYWRTYDFFLAYEYSVVSLMAYKNAKHRHISYAFSISAQ